MISTLLLMLVAVLLAIVFGFVRRLRQRQTHLERELERHRQTARSILRELGAVIVVLFVFASCGGRERPVSASCTPYVNVTVKTKPAKKNASPQREVVQVYWDVSKSMRIFDLTPVVETLDSRVLLSAHAQVVEQYGVGESIRPFTSARDALRLDARRTAQHLAAEKIGSTLASGAAQAALVVSDMELDAPPLTSPTVCGGIPLPSTRDAGALFGRCFEKAIGIRTHLLVHVFRQRVKNDELFIVLFATDRAFGNRISQQIAQRLDFTRHVIFDSGAVAAANVGQCKMTLTQPEAYALAGERCGAKCLDPSTTIRSECSLKVPSDAWIHPVAEPPSVRFTIPCNANHGRFDTTVDFRWRNRGKTTFAKSPNVRDLFDSLADAILRTIPPRRMTIGVDLQ